MAAVLTLGVQLETGSIMSTQPIPLFTHEEFLEREVQSEFRHEYKQGRIEMMAGGSRNHAVLQANAVGELRSALAGRDCTVVGESLLVHIAAANASTYPDSMVICGEEVYADRRKNIVTNPIVIVEVTSPSTGQYDRKEKFKAYQLLPTLKEYVLISQNEPLVEVLRRSDSGEWIKTEYRGLQAFVRLESLDIRLPVSGLYARVVLV